MTKKEKEEIKRAIELFNSDEKDWHDAMDILYNLIYHRLPYKEFDDSLTETVSINELYKKAHKK